MELYKYLLTDNGIITQKTDNLDFFNWSADSFKQNGYDVYDITYNLDATADGNVVTEYESKFRAQGMPIYALKARIIR